VKRRWTVLLSTLAVLGIAPLFLTAIGQEFYMNLLIRVVVLSIAVVALDFILGYGGMISFGQAMFMATGGYVTGMLALNAGSTVVGLPGTTNALIAWPVAMIIAGVLGLVVGLVALRTSGVVFLMITLAMAQLVFFILNALSLEGGSNEARHPRPELPIFDLSNDRHLFYVALILLTAVTIGLQLLVRSPFGRTIRAARSNPMRMQALGYNPVRQQILAFGLAAAITGLAGGLAVTDTPFLEPALGSWIVSGEFLVMVILGGQGTIVGGIFGVAGFLGLEEALTSRTSDWEFYFGIGLVLFVLFVRRGIAGLFLGTSSDE